MQQRHLQHRRNQMLEILPAQFRIEIFAGDDLALLGDADARGNRAGRLREDRLVARSATAANGPSAAVENAQRDAATLEYLDQRHLGLVEFPAGGEESPVLV